MRKVSVPENVVTGKLFSPEEWVSIVNELGCKLSLSDYQTLLLAIGTYECQGFKDRGPEQDGQGVFRTPCDPHTGKPLKEELPADAVEMKLKHLLWVSLQKHFHLVKCGNRWPDTFAPADIDPVEFPRDMLGTAANPNFASQMQNQAEMQGGG